MEQKPLHDMEATTCLISIYGSIYLRLFPEVLPLPSYPCFVYFSLTSFRLLLYQNKNIGVGDGEVLKY